MIDKKEYDGLDNAVENTGRVRILLAVGYKDGMIYARRVDKDLFFWDAVWHGQLYSNYMVITPEKDENGNDKEMSDDVLHEVTDMCYAGAAATIDTLRGDEATEEEKKIVEMMESKREAVEKGEEPVKENSAGVDSLLHKR